MRVHLPSLCLPPLDESSLDGAPLIRSNLPLIVAKIDILDGFYRLPVRPFGDKFAPHLRYSPPTVDPIINGRVLHREPPISLTSRLLAEHRLATSVLSSLAVESERIALHQRIQRSLASGYLRTDFLCR